nr:BglII/BstYI family type II restriction endonuclease [Burkholderia ubonensis]
MIACEIEWNNKDPFFDRDLENFKRLHAEGAISVGILITRGKSLQDFLWNAVYRFTDDRKIESYEDLEKNGYVPTPKQRRNVMKPVERAVDPILIEPPDNPFLERVDGHQLVAPRLGVAHAVLSFEARAAREKLQCLLERPVQALDERFALSFLCFAMLDVHGELLKANDSSAFGLWPIVKNDLCRRAINVQRMSDAKLLEAGCLGRCQIHLEAQQRIHLAW